MRVRSVVIMAGGYPVEFPWEVIDGADLGPLIVKIMDQFTGKVTAITVPSETGFTVIPISQILMVNIETGDE